MDIPAQFLAFGVQTGSHDAIKLFFGLGPLPGTEVNSCQPQPGNVLDLVQFGVGDHPFQPLLRGRRIAAVLGQIDDEGQEYMVACASRTLNKHEKNYSPYQGEMLAAVYGVRTFRHLLFGCHANLVTDHEPLEYLMSNRDLEGQHARWALMLQEVDITLVHRPGA